jgi:hypothetical protein
VEIEQVQMTPADAARLLENNTINRKLSRHRAAGFTAIIERGEWQFDGNPIKIADDGTVVDGQHRLRGIADADVESAPVLLITGLPASARKAVDCGKTRTFADYLEIEGVLNSQTMAAAVRGIWNYENGFYSWEGGIFTRPAPSIPQLWEAYEKRRPELEEAVGRANQVIRVVHVARSPVATAWMVLGSIECGRCSPAADDREDFYDQLTLRNAGPQSDGTMTFIRLMNKRGNAERDSGPGSVKYSQTHQLALLFKAWNAYREGKPVDRLSWVRGGRNREKFPVPH